jgi:DNA-binding beta-propeller fold protein YncE
VCSTPLLWHAPIAAAAPPPAGSVAQLGGVLGCFSWGGESEDGPGTCSVGRGIDRAESVAVSPDGRNVYVGSYQDKTEPGLAVFARDPFTGALTQLEGTAGCVTADGASAAGPGTCTMARAFGTGDGRDLVFTSDGLWAYMVNQSPSGEPVASIVIFRRDPATGALTQLPGAEGCLSADGSSQDGPGTCQTLNTLVGPNGISISSDDRYVYVDDFEAHRILVLARNPLTGGLVQIQCLHEAGKLAPPFCSVGRVLGEAKSLVLSPDGLHAYSADYSAGKSGLPPSGGVSVFDRDPETGALSQKAGEAGCITNTGEDDTGASTCARGRVLGGADAMSIAPNGGTLYVAAYREGGVAAFHVSADGSLTQLPGTGGCVTMSGADDLGAPTCGVARALQGPYGSAVSPDGRTLYVTEFSKAGEGGLAVFALDPATGAPSELEGLPGCVTADGASGGEPGLCADGRGLAEAFGPAVSPDGTSVYVAAYGGHAVGVYARTTVPTCAAASATTWEDAPVTVELGCANADAVPIAITSASAPAHGTLGAIVGSRVTYTPAAGYSGPDSFTFAASDGTNGSPPATASVVVLAHGASAPVLSGLTQSATRWREGRGPARISRAHRPRRPQLGTSFRFSLSTDATVHLTFTQSRPGRRRGRRCVAPAPRNRHARPCRRTTVETLTVAGHAGRDTIAFQGTITPGHRLALGRWSVSLQAVDAAGRSAPRRLSFTIVKG